MNAIWTIARKELSDSFCNRWLVAISLVFATLALGIAWFGAAASGQVGYASTPATIASLASLGIFLIPLIALLLAYDAIVGEEEGGTLLLLMTYPLSKNQLLLGKFLGHGLTLALATLIGFGVAAIAIDRLQLDPALEVAAAVTAVAALAATVPIHHLHRQLHRRNLLLAQRFRPLGCEKVNGAKLSPTQQQSKPLLLLPFVSSGREAPDRDGLPNVGVRKSQRRQWRREGRR